MATLVFWRIEQVRTFLGFTFFRNPEVQVLTNHESGLGIYGRDGAKKYHSDRKECPLQHHDRILKDLVQTFQWFWRKYRGAHDCDHDDTPERYGHDIAQN